VSNTIRVLGLGNDLLADDAFGVEIVRDLRATLPPSVETASSIASGFALLDEVMDADHLIVIDTIATGDAEPGTVYQLEMDGAELKIRPSCGDLGEAQPAAEGGSPHYVGLFETLRLGRELGLHVPEDVVILAVEAGDCLTIGGDMSSKVRAAKAAVAQAVETIVRSWDTGLETSSERASVSACGERLV
jgi:hydrogenase maturation protease